MKIFNHVQNQGAKPYGAFLDIKWFVHQLEQIYIYPTKQETQKILKDLNFIKNNVVNVWKEEILKSLKGELKYRFLTLKRTHVSQHYKLFTRYFEEINNTSVALNGWIMNYDKMEEFVISKENYYLRRQVVIWEDLIKLNFVKNDKNSEIWKKMKKYCEQMADCFDGFRLDNFHNSYIPSCQYFINSAQKINKNLFIVSELFSPNQELKVKLIETVGVHRLVTEFQNCYDIDSLAQKIYENQHKGTIWLSSQKKIFNQFMLKKVKSFVPRTILYDQTHDNLSFFQKFNYKISLPFMAILSFLDKMLGTTKGFDELMIEQYSVTCLQLYPKISAKIKQIENSKYQILFLFDQNNSSSQIDQIYKVELKGSWDNWEHPIELQNYKNTYYTNVSLKQGEYQYKFIVNENHWVIDTSQEIIESEIENNFNNKIIVKTNDQIQHENLVQIRKFFNCRHSQVANNKMKEKSHKINDFIIIERYQDNCSQGKMLISRVNYELNNSKGNLIYEIPGIFKKIQRIFFFTDKMEIQKVEGNFHRIKAEIIEDRELQQYGIIQPGLEKNIIHLRNIPENFVMVLDFVQPQHIIDNITQLNSIFQEESKSIDDKLKYINFDIEDINYYLYTCNNEEQEYWQSDCYYIPEYGQLAFAGFSGLKRILQDSHLEQTFEHPLYHSVQDNDSLLKYFEQRLMRYKPSKLKIFIEYFLEISEKIQKLPKFLKPYYFHVFILQLIIYQENRYLEKIHSLNILKANSLYQYLLLSLPQFLTKKNNFYLTSAGIPHFTTGIWKNWGRDTFIAFKGCFIIPGFYQEGKNIILHYAAYLRHGLIPNLLEPSRFNARDATWWFIKAINDYIDQTNDYEILKEKIKMKFLSDDKNEHEKMKNENFEKFQTLIEIIQEIFQKHALGINFEEWNAPSIDCNMNKYGFKIHLYVNWNNGFIFGGNQNNCLTWMDKMGSSIKAKNKGVPATPRNGSPIELVSLLYIGIKMMKLLYEEGFSKYEGVLNDMNEYVKYSSWKKLIEKNFQKYYWVPKNENEFKNFLIEPHQVQRFGILKDCYSEQKTDYQLRPNALISLSLTPNLINEEYAQQYLENVSNYLIGQNSIGIKTLDPGNNLYRPNYENSNDSDDFFIAQGFNYHNGPEWVWLYGYFIRALHQYEKKCDLQIATQINRLKKHLFVMKNSDFLSLPELTNDNGSVCNDSCSSQLWSVACLLEAIDIMKFQIN